MGTNMVSRYFPTNKDTITLDTLFIVPKSLSVQGLNGDEFLFFEKENQIVFLRDDKSALPDSVLITYRTLPIGLKPRYFHKDPRIIEQHVLLGHDYRHDAAKKESTGLLQAGNMDYWGNYGRSLAVGNNQDAVMNSQFNLQLSGYLLDSIKIEAAITDNNIPFQPEGNTQKLQEFDKVFITFSKNRHRLTLGDYAIDKPNSYFLNFNKRVQGIQYQGVLETGAQVEHRFSFSGSVAKGQFTRNVFQGIEGNQGPYKLQGENGEQYFIVLAGSERVYIDGELLTRGEDRDYTINYNLAEITFTPKRLITKDKRIQVEFEYQSRSYLNSLFHVSDEISIGQKLKLNFNFYANQDAKNSNITQSLSDEQKDFLATIGDSIHLAYYNTAQADSFAANKILYQKKDTLVDGILYSDIYEYSTDPQKAKYSVGFSFVGSGKGNYILSDLNTNGRSYQWVAPVNGIPQGDFEPKVLLITPKKHQVLTAAASYALDTLKTLSFEWAGSEYSPNTFSSIHNSMHWGNALKAAYHETRVLARDSNLNINKKWTSSIAYEFVDSRFEAIAPYRNVEFSRDWNIADELSNSDEHLIQFQTGYSDNKHGNIQYNLSYYSRGSSFNANRHLVEAKWKAKKIFAATQSSLLLNNSHLTEGSFFRPKAQLEYFLDQNQLSLLGVAFEQELNALHNKGSDSLNPSAHRFDVSKLYWSYNPAQAQLDLSYTYRSDYRPGGRQFELQSTAHTIDMAAAVRKWKQHQLSFNTSYRVLHYHTDTAAAQQQEQTILGRINYSGNLLKSAIVPSLLYDFGTGQEQKRQFTFIEVPAGQGTHMWIDYNDDGVQQVNEFEIAIFEDQKKYVKIITPTNEYVKVNYLHFNFSLLLSPEQIWRKNEQRNGWQNFASRWSNHLSIQINNRILNNAGIAVYNPFKNHFTDTQVVTAQRHITNTLYFNRSHLNWGGEYTINSTSNEALLTYGLEGQSSLRHQERLRWTLNKRLSLILNSLQGRRSFSSPINDNRSYQVQYLGWEPSFTYLYENRFRLSTAYKYEQRKNAPQYQSASARINNINLECKFTSLGNGSFSARGTFSHIRFTGIANSPVSFVILETLANGNNWLWNLNWSTRLSKAIEFSLNYDGRKPGNQPVVHTGNMSIRAIL